MSLTVRTTAEVDAQIREIDRWWRRNRPASPDFFAREIAAWFEIIGDVPQIGRVYSQSPISGTRRVLLKGSRYHVYYVPQADHLMVVAIWHAQRGTGPSLHLL